MKIVVLASGSKGNVTYVEGNNCKLLIDAGKNYKYIKEKLEEIGVNVKDINYVLISHNHTDHISALKTLLARSKATVVISEKMMHEIEDLKDYPKIIFLEDTINLDGINVISFRSSHDAVDSRNFVLEEDGKKVCYVTDTGYVNTRNFKYLKDLDVYLFESNHDIELLQHGPYPAWVKARILSDEGHLSNKASAFYLTKLIGPNTKEIVLMHLSECNNMEDIALEEVNNTFIDYDIDFHNIIVARQDEESEVISV